MRPYVLLLAGGVALAAVPPFVGEFQVTLLTQALSWGILSLAVWLLLRYCYLPSFGHAAFFGVGAYAAGLAVTRWSVDNVFIGLGIALLASCVAALPIALIVSRLKSVSFLLVTLAYATMLAALAGRWSVTGGSDGLAGVVRPDASPLPVELADPANFYYFAVGVLLVSMLVLLVVVGSPFGGVLLGIRESEQRMAALGYNPAPYRAAVFVLSAALAGAAGLVSAYLTSFVDPGDVGAIVSARALLYAVVGGGTLFGPPLAAIGFTELEHVLSSQTDRWLGLLGLVYVLVALVPWNRAGALFRRLRLPVRLSPAKDGS